MSTTKATSSKIMAIAELLKTDSNVQLVVNVMDLKEFALTIMQVAKAEALAEKEPEKWLTRNECAKVFGISTNTLWRWQRDGYLVPHKVGRKTMYKQSEVDQLMNGETNENGKEAKDE